jgi:hypothetical protein
MFNNADRVLLIDECNGVYIPQIFAKRYPDHVHNDEDMAALIAGPEHELYWEVWDAILRDVTVTVGSTCYNLEQDGDLWAVASR